MAEGTENPREKEGGEGRDRRSVSRRGLLTDELGKAGLQVARQLPAFAPVLGFLIKEGTARRDERLVRELWQLALQRPPKPQESAAGLELVRGARTVEEKGDALADILWALCHTAEFEGLRHTDQELLHGAYHVAVGREPTPDEEAAALAILAEAAEPAARSAALEGLFTGLIRSADSALRRTGPRG
jgi:hypothetical protein